MSGPEQRLLGTVIGWNAMAIALAAAAGPAIGSAILVMSSWPWLFAVNVPVGAVVLLAARALPRPPGTNRRVDLLSAALNAAAFACLILGIDRAPDAHAAGAVLPAVAVVSFTVLIRREATRTAPLVPLDLLRDRPFRISVIASMCCFAGQMTSYVALPFYLQHGLGQDAFHTGLYLTPWPLVVAVAGPISGRLADRTSNGLLCAMGGMQSGPARLRFAMHVERLCPTHVWPHWIYAQLAEEPTEWPHHLAPIKVADEQLGSEQAGTATRKRDRLEDEITRKALRSYSEWLADEGFPSQAASLVAKLLELDPEDELGILDMAKSKGIIPACVPEQGCGTTM